MTTYRLKRTDTVPGPTGRRNGTWRDTPALWAAGWLLSAAWAGSFPLLSGLATHRRWGLFAAMGYLLAAAVAAWAPGSRSRAASALVALAGAVLLPLTVLVATGQGQSEVAVIERSADLLIHSGSPYHPDPRQVEDFTPYLPGVALLGLPRVLLGATPLADARLWCAAVLTGCLVAGRLVQRPRRRRSAGGRTGFGQAVGSGRTPFGRQTAHGRTGAGRLPGGRVAAGGSAGRRPVDGRPPFGPGLVALVASPVVALPLCVSGVDLPLTGACCLGLALAARGRPVATGLALALACSIKWSAWPALPVALALLAAVHGRRPAVRCAVVCLAATAALVLPVALVAPHEMAEQVLAFPTGRAAVPTPAGSPLPGRLLAGSGPAGWSTAVAMLAAGGAVLAVSLFLRPPASLVAAADRLALGLTLAFSLAPAGRFGYLALPLVLVTWARLAGPPGARTRQTPTAQPGGGDSSALRPKTSGRSPQREPAGQP
ncbi:hypothetical protein [Kitasatospora cystarginea]|uniref:hypothetical protein n=1 Tax=Kitasatospora cystarginea TaxID=58350 RepID=UPI0031DA3677